VTTNNELKVYDKLFLLDYI